MTVAVYDFPLEWVRFITTQKFNPRSINQSAGTNWNGTGGTPSGPHTQIWLTEITFAPLADWMAPELGPVLQDMDAFFSRLRGRAGVVRMFWVLRTAPWYDRNLAASTSYFSDGSHFSDGSGFASGYLPPEIQIATAAIAKSRYLVLSGLPVSTASVLRQGDLIQIKPNGIAGTVPHLYKIMIGGGTDAAGQIGVTIEPSLRQGVAAGDTVSLRYPSSLFRMSDDSQFDVEGNNGGQGSIGGSLVEALDLVP